MPSASPVAVPLSLRERQQEAIRLRIMDAGIPLFLQHGFVDTTMDMIANGAGVSRRTVFRHFNSKEEIVLAWSYLSIETLSAEVRCRSSAEPPLACLRAALIEHVATHQERLPAALLVGRLIEETPSLRAYSANKYSIWESILADALAERPGTDSDIRTVAPVAAMVAVGIFRIAVKDWIDGGGAQPLSDLLRTRFATLDALGSGLNCTGS